MNKFNNPRKLFDTSIEVVHTRRPDNRDYHNNGFRSVSGAAAGINRALVEKGLSYVEFVQLASTFPRVIDPEKKVASHFKNILYYASPDTALKWDLLRVLKVQEATNIPPCLVIVVDGREMEMRDDFNDAAVALLRRAEKITSPLLERLSELAG